MKVMWVYSVKAPWNLIALSASDRYKRSQRNTPETVLLQVSATSQGDDEKRYSHRPEIVQYRRHSASRHATQWSASQFQKEASKSVQE